MANIKFSAFTQKVDQANVDFLVGYTGTDNVRIAPSTIGQGVYVLKAGDTMTGNLNLDGNTRYLNIRNAATNTVASLSADGSGDGQLILRDSAGTNKVMLYGEANADQYIANGGKLGINTTSPTSTLHVAGTSFFFDQAVFDDKVGIGTSSPGGKLEVAGGSDGIVLSNAGDGSSYDQVSITYSGFNSGTPEFVFKPKSAPGSGNVNSFFRFSTLTGGGTNTANLTVDGKVGIGTNAPSANLHVKSSGNGEVNIERASGALINLQAQSALGVIGTNSNHNLSFKTNSNVGLTLTTGGKVGIGTTSPAEKLHVFDSGYPQLNLESNGGSWQLGVSSGNDFALRKGTSGSDYGLWIDSTLNVGIGTTSPSHPLDVFNTDAPSDILARFKTDDNSTYIQLVSAGSSWQIGATSDSLDWYNDNNSAVRMSLLETGNLGIGTTAPYAKLSVNNGTDINLGIKVGQTDTTAVMLNAYNDAVTANIPLEFRASKFGFENGLFWVGDTTTNYGYQSHHITRDYSQGYALIVRNSNTTTQNNSVLQLNQAETTSTTQGYFLIGRQGDPSSGTNRILIFSNGDVQNVNNSYGAISDETLKENIVDATPKLDDLMKVKIRNYNFIGQENKQIGVIAQEIENVFPSLVEDTKDPESEETTKSVKYSVLVPIMLKAIQELKAEVESLKNK